PGTRAGREQRHPTDGEQSEFQQVRRGAARQPAALRPVGRAVPAVVQRAGHVVEGSGREQIRDVAYRSALPTVSRYRGLALCTIPKNACTSMKQAILEIEGIPEWVPEHRNHPALRLATIDQVGDLFTAAF